ncbi:MAG: DNA mismatch repair protein MutL [Candidatus Methanoperedens nitroreducens]|uniref:DNA mismatch repair protein MutL n=1 Tax=Candidatus Methanoperedens nitratireducens TaxID=1392998 RepID=A0A0P8CKS2_9EURY|nr:MAG: DNA mismatch repair protein MutL [Candidatus Methanoperedens sp. BLZ1]
MKFASEAIGIRLIETVTSGLYDGNLNCLREYVQNGIDAGAKNIEISFENGDQNLIIQDDGSGMNKFELENKALGIGVSDKTEEDAGWRGIGIWSGVPICQRIVIITKKCDDKKFRIQINNDALRNEYMSNRPVLDILSNATGEIEELPLGNDESFEKDHYTIVRLESILYNQKNIFNKDDIHSYLSSVVPAPFDAKQFELATEIDKWLNEKGVKYPSVNINFYGRIFRPPYKSDIFFKGFIQKEFIVGDKLIAVGWFLTTNKNEKLDKPNGGVYFKKKGFTLGDENLVLRQYSGTYHPWQYGEIHIISRELRENAARNNFEYNNRIVQTFLANVEEYIRQLEIQNHYQSDRIAANQIKKAQKYLENEDLQSAEKLADKIKRRLNKSARFPVEPSLKIMQPLIDSKFEQDKKEFSILETKINEIKSTTRGRKKRFLIKYSHQQSVQTCER